MYFTYVTLIQQCLIGLHVLPVSVVSEERTVGGVSEGHVAFTQLVSQEELT